MSRPEFTVRLLEAAEDDLFEIVTYVATDRPAAATAIAERLEKSMGLLGASPRLGRVPREPDLAELGYRYLVVDDYLVFYKIEGRYVLVYRILHGARDYESLL